MTNKPTTAQILDTAIQLAEKSSWEAVRLHDIADKLKISLTDIKKHYREKNDLVNAWFERADEAMLKDAKKKDFKELPTQQQLHRLIMTWLDSMAQHKKVTKQMLCSEIMSGHLHITINGITRSKRTVHWMLEAANRESSCVKRMIEEKGLCCILMVTMTHWFNDKSKGEQKTHHLLSQLLYQAENAAHISDHWVLKPCEDILKDIGFH